MWPRLAGILFLGFFGALPASQAQKPIKLAILIDGMGTEGLRSAITANEIPNLAKFFRLSNRTPLPLARTAFPAETYSGVISFLTGKSVDQHGIIANKFFNDRGEVDLEDPNSRVALSIPLKEQSVYPAVHLAGGTSLGISAPFSLGATEVVGRRIVDGVRYLNRDYAGIDERSVDKLLEALRAEESPAPDFIFLHLVGYDGVSHAFGSSSESARRYLKKLDTMLGPLFRQITQKSSRPVHVILTADHGFRSNLRLSGLAAELERKADIRVLPSARILQARGRKQRIPLSTLRKLAASISEYREVFQSVFLRAPGVIEVHGPGAIVRTYRKLPGLCADQSPLIEEFRGRKMQRFVFCESDTRLVSGVASRRYAIPKLLEFFNAPRPPEMLILASDNYYFVDHGKGHHGSTSSAEMLVPFLSMPKVAIADADGLQRIISLEAVLPAWLGLNF